MQLRHLFISTLAALPFGTLAEGNSPWLPIPGQVSLGLNHTEQSGYSDYIGSTELPLTAITGGAASKFRRATTTLRLDYGLSDAVSFDASIGFAKVRVGAADNDSGRTDNTLGLRWRVLDEFENPAVPTLTLRAAAILKGNYDGARLAGLGNDANGFEVAVVGGKKITSTFALGAEIGVQSRSSNAPNATFYGLNARYRFASQWSASLGYGSKKR